MICVRDSQKKRSRPETKLIVSYHSIQVCPADTK